MGFVGFFVLLLWEIDFSFLPSYPARLLIVCLGGLLGRVEGAEPNANAFSGVSDLGRPFPPRTLADSSVEILSLSLLVCVPLRNLNSIFFFLCKIKKKGDLEISVAEWEIKGKKKGRKGKEKINYRMRKEGEEAAFVGARGRRDEGGCEG